MGIQEHLRGVAIGFLLMCFSLPTLAATVYGTVTGPEGPVANARIIANQCKGAPVEHAADANGYFSIEFPDETLDCLQAESPDANSNLFGEAVEWIDASEDSEVHLFLARKVTISGTVVWPSEFEGDIGLQRLDKFNVWSVAHWEQNEHSFNITLAAGVYAIWAEPGCEHNEILETYICPTADYFSSVTVDATEGSVQNVVIPLADPTEPLIDSIPPLAAQISVGPPDEGGTAMVSGAPGTVPGPALITIINLVT